MGVFFLRERDNKAKFLHGCVASAFMFFSKLFKRALLSNVTSDENQSFDYSGAGTLLEEGNVRMNQDQSSSYRRFHVENFSRKVHLDKGFHVVVDSKDKRWLDCCLHSRVNNIYNADMIQNALGAYGFICKLC
ncbi:hypothetical protein J1N35_005179 [Gossypium stocksii]|uniref:Uncharacterized protein n=1 Tax=Gossypium stocksii TaxID=47602 RepID=A0A9D3WDB4_9ROSI|nr:hypothetical protein J1N35_005179 [Gossypium stocksii]